MFSFFNDGNGNGNGHGNGNGNGNGHGANGRRSLWTRSKSREPDLAPYRRLALQLHFDLSGPDVARSALLAAPGGASLCAHASTSLARCLGEQLRRNVLLVDTCLKGSEASRLMDCAANRGFTDVLSDPGLSIEQLVVPTTCETVSFLPSGSRSASVERVTPEQLLAFLDAARQKYDFVLLSGGDVLNDPLVLAIASLVGCVLLVVVENQTKVDDLNSAQSALRLCGTKKTGLVWAASSGGDR